MKCHEVQSSWELVVPGICIYCEPVTFHQTKISSTLLNLFQESAKGWNILGSKSLSLPPYELIVRIQTGANKTKGLPNDIEL